MYKISNKDLKNILGKLNIFIDLKEIQICTIKILQVLSQNQHILSSIIATASILTVIILFNMFPEKWLVILGSPILFLVIINVISVNILYPKIPDFIGKIGTCKNQVSLIQLNTFFAIFSFWKLFCISVGVFKKEKS
jgi:hypothetical protein